MSSGFVHGPKQYMLAGLNIGQLPSLLHTRLQRWRAPRPVRQHEKHLCNHNENLSFCTLFQLLKSRANAMFGVIRSSFKTTFTQAVIPP
jgi:hypothetical protein